MNCHHFAHTGVNGMIASLPLAPHGHVPDAPLLCSLMWTNNSWKTACHMDLAAWRHHKHIRAGWQTVGIVH